MNASLYLHYELGLTQEVAVSCGNILS